MASGQSIEETLEAVWRQHRLSLIAALTRRLGSLDQAEDALADAVETASSAWQSGTSPNDPAAWLYRVALRKGLDRLRQASHHQDKEPIIRTHLEATSTSLSVDEMPEERLGLFFLCAHPSLSKEAQVALMLYHMVGMSAPRIADAFMVKEATIHQRLKRARDKLRANNLTTEVPPPARWRDRIAALLAALEIAYAQSHGELGGGREILALGQDARQLVDTLTQLLPTESEVAALAALLSLFEARRGARLSLEGIMIPLSDQDPTRWSEQLITEAGEYLGLAAKSVATSVLPPTNYTLRAQIEVTRMTGLKEGIDVRHELNALYASLHSFCPTPAVAMNYALAHAQVSGPQAGLNLLETYCTDHDLTRHAPWHLTRAELLRQAGDIEASRRHLQIALSLVREGVERQHIQRQLQKLS